MDTMESYARAQDGFDEMLAVVPREMWDMPSECAGWTLRDVTGHVIWGQEQVRHWATGQDYTSRTGAPGAPRPGEMAGDDHPLATWRAARAASVRSLTDEALGRLVSVGVLGEVPLATMIDVFMADHLIHTWDIGHALGIDVRLDRQLVSASLAWADRGIRREPGFFGPQLAPPPDADDQTRLLAFLGRGPWEPVST